MLNDQSFRDAVGRVYGCLWRNPRREDDPFIKRAIGILEVSLTLIERNEGQAWAINYFGMPPVETRVITPKGIEAQLLFDAREKEKQLFTANERIRQLEGIIEDIKQVVK